ncbi:LacI family DNA-binding transcriptional regulator [Nonomuraea rubra]|uniref:LacI family DNA-binding transcriptional regulator n=1 Tax=Nonomuraea rubra TaxID=46180 RepID=UPI0036143BDF
MLDRPDRPTAIFAASDGMALKTLEVAKGLGLDVPGDLSVAGFDNIPESALAEPGLTTVDQSMYRLGYEAARMLKSLVRGDWDGPGRLVLPTRLVVRGSTAAPGKCP